MKRENNICSAEIGSVTQAMMAEKALSHAAIPSAVIKKESSSRSKGCVYGIEFSCAQLQNVRAVLDAAKIYVRAWENDR